MTEQRAAEPSDVRHFDVVVIGAGVAGLAFTLRLPPALRVALLTKGDLGESNTRYAQGGLAAAVGADDSPALHEADTLAAGAGLCDPGAVRRLVEGAPAAVEWLIAQGTRFDSDDRGQPLLGREAAHNRRRIMHAGGDATGAEIERALVTRVRVDPAIEVFERAFARDLLVEAGRCIGVLVDLDRVAAPVRLEAPVTVLAAGGAGQLWATTSNPPGATADGLAMALRAGAVAADLEFAQFHPTVLALAGTDPFLVSEAVRGEGAYLRGANGYRFLAEGPLAHPLAELAPRDVVARAIQWQMAIDGADHVYLDLRHLDPDAMPVRFPTIARELAARGLNVAADPLPVAPAAHYFMGGVVASAEGTTSLPGLLAIGEAACTGVHGANRLASNSLLEGLVFGIAAAEAIGAGTQGTTTLCRSDRVDGLAAAATARSGLNGGDRPDERTVAEWREVVQRAMSRDVAVVRNRAGLDRARAALGEVAVLLARVDPVLTAAATTRALWEVSNMVAVGLAIVAAADRRQESRGAHYRDDFPAVDPRLDGRHSIVAGGSWRWGTLAEALDSSPVAPVLVG